ncbi:MAG: hypothetical protein C4318_02105 [Acidimicrobiia bacterium]
MPVLAWIGIIVSLLVVVPVLYFLGRAVVTIVVARRELERPNPAAGVVEIAGPKKAKRPSEGGRSRKASEQQAMEEALKKLATKSRRRESNRGSGDSGEGQVPGE